MMLKIWSDCYTRFLSLVFAEMNALIPTDSNSFSWYPRIGRCPVMHSAFLQSVRIILQSFYQKTKEIR